MTALFHKQDTASSVLLARTWCAFACSVTAISFAAKALSGATDPVPMPITPPLMTAVVAAALTIVILAGSDRGNGRSEEHTSELQSRFDLVCRLLLEKK